MKTPRLAALAVLPLALAASGCANIATLLGDETAEPTATATQDPAAPLADGLALAAVDSVSPDECPEGDDSAFAMAAGAWGDAIRCVTIVPDERIDVSGGEVEEAPPASGATDTTVQVTLEGADVDALADLTADVAQRTAPQNQVAILVGDEVVIAPTVTTAIQDGMVQISGGDLGDLYDRLAG